MTAPTYASDLNDIFLDGGTTWTLVGGGRQTNTETDDYIQGSSSWSHDPFSSGIEGGVMNSSETVASDDAIYYWIKCDVAATLATHAAGGMQCLVGNLATALKAYYVRGSDDYAYGGWICVPIDPTMTQSTSIGSPTSTTAWFGAQWNVPSTGASKGYPMKVDAMRHGRQIQVYNGDSGTPATWDSVSAYDATTSRMWGICQPTTAGAALQGLIYWGTAGTAVYSRDSNRTITLIDTEWTVSDFTQLLFAHASNDIIWDNVGLIALGTSNRGIIDITADGAITWTNSVHKGIDTTAMLAGSTFDGTTWIGTNAVTSPAGSMVGCKILTPTVAADTGGLIYNATVDPDSKLEDMVFEMGAADHHAIDFGTAVDSSLTTITLRGQAFNGFGAVDDSNDSALRFLATTGALTLNLIDCTVDGVVPVPQGSTVVETTGSTDTIDAGAASSSTGITVPSDCTFVVATWIAYDDGSGTTMSAIDIASDDFTIEQNVGDSGNAAGYGCAVLESPSVGAQTFAWAWSGGSPQFGGVISLTYVKGQSIGTPVRDSDGETSESSGARSVTLTTEDTDLIIGHLAAYQADTAFVLNGGSTLINNYNYQEFGNDIANIGADATSTDVDSSGSAYTLVAISIASAASGAAQNFSIDSAAGITITPIVDAIPLKITVTDSETGLVLDDARVYLHKEGDLATVYFEDETNASGEVNDSIIYPGDTSVVGWVRQMDVTGIDYHPEDIAGTITDTGLDIEVALDPMPADYVPPVQGQSILDFGASFEAASGKVLNDTVTLTAGTNRKLILFNSFEDGTGAAVLQDLYDLNPMTNIASGAWDVASNYQTEISYYDIPDGHSGVKAIAGGTTANRTNRELSWVIIGNSATGAVDGSSMFVESFGTSTSQTTTLTNSSADAFMVQMVHTNLGSAFSAGSGDTLDYNAAGAVGQQTIVSELYDATASQSVSVSWTTGAQAIKGGVMVLKA